LVRVPLMAGWQGRIVRIDAVGDALIQFENHVKLQWISKRHLVHIKRQFHAEVPSDMEPAFRVSAAQVTDVDGKRGFPVWLHVYDLGRASKVLLNNCWLARQEVGAHSIVVLKFWALSFHFRPLQIVIEKTTPRQASPGTCPGPIQDTFTVRLCGWAPLPWACLRSCRCWSALKRNGLHGTTTVCVTIALTLQQTQQVRSRCRGPFQGGCMEWPRACWQLYHQ